MSWLRVLAIRAVVTLTLLEIVLRIHNPLPFRQRGDQLILPAGQRYAQANPPTPKLDPIAVVTRNRLGFRGPEPPDDWSSRLSIVVVGGSATECALISDGKTWPDVMAAALAARHPNLWVNNAGFSGHTTLGHRVLLSSKLVPLRPTVVLFMAGINDVGMAATERESDFSHLSDRWVNRLARHSEVINTALNLVRAWRARYLWTADDAVDLATHPKLALDAAAVAEAVRAHQPLLAGYEARLRRLIVYARRAGIDPVLITQPALLGDGIDPATGVRLGPLDYDREHDAHTEGLLLEMYNDAMRRVAMQQGVFLVDLAHLMPKDSQYYYDFIHFSNAGARLVGQLVAAQLDAHLERLRPRTVSDTLPKIAIPPKSCDLWKTG